MKIAKKRPKIKSLITWPYILWLLEKVPFISLIYINPMLSLLCAHRWKNIHFFKSQNPHVELHGLIFDKNYLKCLSDHSMYWDVTSYQDPKRPKIDKKSYKSWTHFVFLWFSQNTKFFIWTNLLSFVTITLSVYYIINISPRRFLSIFIWCIKI